MSRPRDLSRRIQQFQGFSGLFAGLLDTACFKGKPMIDTFKTHVRSLTAPPECAEAITPSDTETTGHVTRALYVGGSGNLVVQMQNGSVVTLANVPAGTFLPMRAVQVLSSGTSATDIVGFW